MKRTSAYWKARQACRNMCCGKVEGFKTPTQLRSCTRRCNISSTYPYYDTPDSENVQNTGLNIIQLDLIGSAAK